MHDTFKILLIEDDDSVAITVRDNLIEQYTNIAVTIEPDLNNAVDILKQIEPDAVILDLIKGRLDTGDMTGNLSWNEIWNHRFVPLIVYTASTQETDPPLPTEHPFVVRIQKSQANSVIEVVKKLGQYFPYMQAVKELSVSISKDMHRVLTETAPLLWKEETPDASYSPLFSRVLRRRVAASFDSTTGSTDQKLNCWEQFIYPPLETDLLMGDFLRLTGRRWDDPSAYRITITPSCDLVRRNGIAKVPKVLVAKCVDLTVLWEKCNIKKPSSTSAKKRATEHLTLWLSDSIPRSGLMPLPDFPSILPHMAIDLRGLELIMYSEIKGFETDTANIATYERVVSVDSPFREALAWAYMHVACRPGVPDREIEPWVSGLIETYKHLQPDNDSQ